MGLIALFALSVSVSISPAGAQRHRQKCDAVQTSAEIDYDPRLIVNFAADKDAGLCIFYASMPPPSGTSPGARAAGALRASLQTSGPINGNLQSELVPQITEALLAPLQEERLIRLDGKVLRDVVREKEAGTIAACVTEMLAPKRPFKELSPIISCGIAPDGRFIVQASYGSVTVAVLLPLA